jgi:hypothetical protein
MALESVLTRAPRCTLVNITTSEEMERLFNPSQLQEKVQVNWTKLVIPGMSHQLLQFQSTGNRQLTSVEFYLDAFFAAEQPGSPDILQFRSFLRALTGPIAETTNVSSTHPPRCLFVWPGVLSMEAVVAGVDFNYQQFGSGGSVLVYTAQVTFEEILDTRVTSEQRREEVF